MKSVYSVLTDFLCLLFVEVRAKESLDYNKFSQPPVLTGGRYLQVGKQDSMVIRWHTSKASNYKVTWDTLFGIYLNSLTMVEVNPLTDHIVNIKLLGYHLNKQLQFLERNSTIIQYHLKPIILV